MDTLSFKSSSVRRVAGLVLATLMATLMATPLMAQDMGDTRVLKGKNVTESNLLDALTPPPEPVVTRSLKVSRDGAGVSAPERKASASLLITFLTNSSELTESAKQQLDVVAGALKNDRLADYSFNVEGHADPRGSADANMLLSQQRAESVRDYLVTTHRIAADRLKAEGKGDHDLLNRAVPAAPENRRVTIVTNAK
jgi:outer membrane protein OmpA-like peptidoglycan-associated protein